MVAWVTDDDTVMVRALTRTAGEGLNITQADTALYTAPGSIQQADLSRDGRFVAWTYYALEPVKSNRIMFTTTHAPEDGETARPVNVLRKYPRRFKFIGAAAWSPDASKLAFIGKVRRTGATGVYTVDRNGHHLRTLLRATTGGSNGDRLVWSPSGSKVAWLSVSRDPYKFADSWKVYDLHRHRVGRLPNGFFGWSPDEHWMGIARGNLQWSLFRKSVRTGRLQPLVRGIEDHVLTDTGPFWMPDGQVVYEDEEEWLTLSGTRPGEPRRVAVSGDFYCCVSWQ